MINIKFSTDIDSDCAEKVKNNLKNIKNDDGYSVIGEVSKVIEKEKLRISSLDFNNGKIDVEVETSYETVS